MNIEIAISIPNLWEDQVFRRDSWGQINYLVGPNATGKSLFMMELKKQFVNLDLKVRLLSSERLAGLERREYGLFGRSNIPDGFNFGQFTSYKDQAFNFDLASDAFTILRDKLDVRLRDCLV